MRWFIRRSIHVMIDFGIVCKNWKPSATGILVAKKKIKLQTNHHKIIMCSRFIMHKMYIYPIEHCEIHGTFTRNTARNDTYVTDPECVSWNEASKIFIIQLPEACQSERDPKSPDQNAKQRRNFYNSIPTNDMVIDECEPKIKLFPLSLSNSIEIVSLVTMTIHNEKQTIHRLTWAHLTRKSRKIRRKNKTTSAFVCKIQTVLFAILAQISISGNNHRKSDWFWMFGRNHQFFRTRLRKLYWLLYTLFKTSLLNASNSSLISGSFTFIGTLFMLLSIAFCTRILIVFTSSTLRFLRSIVVPQTNDK